MGGGIEVSWVILSQLTNSTVVIKMFKRLKRSFDDWNEASGLVEPAGNPNPYFFLGSDQLRTELTRPSYRSYFQMRPAKRAKMNHYAGTALARRRRRGRRMKRRFKKRRGYKRKVMQHVGDAKTRGVPTKTRVTGLAGTGVLNTLEHADLDQFLINTCVQGPSRNERDMDRIQVAGFMTDLIVFPTGNLPIHLNIAWIANKSEISVDDTNAIVLTRFLRGYEEQRQIPLNNTRSTIELCNTPINSDAWAVIKHKRYVLTGREGATYNDRGSILRKKFWIPIKREFRFTDIAQTVPNNGLVYFVLWATNALAVTGTTQANIAQYQMRTVMFFRDPE